MHHYLTENQQVTSCGLRDYFQWTNGELGKTLMYYATPTMKLMGRFSGMCEPLFVLMYYRHGELISYVTFVSLEELQTAFNEQLNAIK